eukprot:TRINITY_DN240_c9_g1_i1.p1 TRINITY_DN240_c9_g1~~TRINITY_DN240_c9_g1_i1.p1  ORF type:complete len:803 (+),score=302.57 TRINITY_DN240_c9_g1_i1:154-2409(+)
MLLFPLPSNLGNLNRTTETTSTPTTTNDSNHPHSNNNNNIKPQPQQHSNKQPEEIHKPAVVAKKPLPVPKKRIEVDFDLDKEMDFIKQQERFKEEMRQYREQQLKDYEIDVDEYGVDDRSHSPQKTQQPHQQPHQQHGDVETITTLKKSQDEQLQPTSTVVGQHVHQSRQDVTQKSSSQHHHHQQQQQQQRDNDQPSTTQKKVLVEVDIQATTRSSSIEVRQQHSQKKENTNNRLSVPRESDVEPDERLSESEDESESEEDQRRVSNLSRLAMGIKFAGLGEIHSDNEEVSEEEEEDVEDEDEDDDDEDEDENGNTRADSSEDDSVQEHNEGEDDEDEEDEDDKKGRRDTVSDLASLAANLSFGSFGKKDNHEEDEEDDDEEEEEDDEEDDDDDKNSGDDKSSDSESDETDTKNSRNQARHSTIDRKLHQSEYSRSSSKNDDFEVKPGTMVDISERIGKGATATVWSGIIKDRIVAVKRVDLTKYSEGVKYGQRVVHREYDIVRSLKHPNIIKYHGLFYNREMEEVTIIMELIEGVPVTDIVLFMNKLPEKTASYILKHILVGVEFLHKNLILHRDLKPDNVLITASGVIKIIDFGTATLCQIPDEAKRRSTVGTPWYCAPEVINSDEYGAKCDIWSIGCFAIELVSGKPPFDDLNDIACLFKMAEGNPPPLPTDISPSCHDFLSKCLVGEWQLRPTSSQLLHHSFFSQRTDSVPRELNETIVEMKKSKERHMQKVQRRKSRAVPPDPLQL